MLKQYNAVLRSLAGSARRKQQIDKEWEMLYAELNGLERKCDALKAACGRKEDEYGSIEFGWLAIAYGLRGQRRTELESARAAIEELQNQIKATDDKAGHIRREMEALEQEKELLAPSAAEFKRTLSLKYQAMRQGGLLSAEIIQWEEQKRRVKEEIKRVRALWETSDQVMDQLRCHIQSSERGGECRSIGPAGQARLGLQ